MKQIFLLDEVRDDKFYVALAKDMSANEYLWLMYHDSGKYIATAHYQNGCTPIVYNRKVWLDGNFFLEQYDDEDMDIVMEFDTLEEAEEYRNRLIIMCELVD